MDESAIASDRDVVARMREPPHSDEMIDIGEDLVGAYLTRVEECSIVQHNVRTGVNEGEIDVVGLRVVDAQVVEAWFCEVSTHTQGLGGYGGDAPGKIEKKLSTVRAYADDMYPRVTRHIQVWSPKVSPGMAKKLEHMWGEAELVANHDYADRVRNLVALARKQTAFSDSPSFRLLQVLACLPSDPLVAESS